ncbi:MAG: family 20 glycosylhydrolase, partial [Armatimonadota bacterium]
MFVRLLWFVAVALLAAPCLADRGAHTARSLGLIPAPKSLRIEAGRLAAGGGFAVAPGPFPEAAVALGRDCASMAGRPIPGRPTVAVHFVRDQAIAGEAYRVRIDARGVEVAAGEPVGAFRATRTLLQLATSANRPGGTLTVRTELPFVGIDDAPRFAWRGLMLDSSRHFQTPEEIRRWIDRLAMHKLNVFHWHLVDSHGWRLEIRKYPKLTGLAAWREQPPIGRYGGYYTQDEVRGIVAYAEARHVTVVPEIELPGHSQAAVAAYPELLACDPAQQGATAWFHGFPHPRQEFPAVPGADVVCASK